MPFGYIGQNQPKQLVKNAGVVDVMHHGILSKKKQIGQTMELLHTETISNAATVDITTGLGSGYDTHIFQLHNIHTAGDNKDLEIRVFVSGSIVDSGTDYQRSRRLSEGGTSEHDDRDDDMHTLKLKGETGNASGEAVNGYLYMYNALSSTIMTHFHWQMGHIMHNSVYQNTKGVGSYKVATALTGIRFYLSSGNISSGTIKVYGLKQ